MPKASMVLLDHDVLTAGIARMRWIYDEFDRIVISFSGGKDSTICLELAIMVARERNRLPVDVFFVDQEAEWDCTIDYIRLVQARKEEVAMHWFQGRLQISSGVANSSSWLQCWAEEAEAEWVRAKEPTSIHVNDLGTMNFKKIASAYSVKHWPDERLVHIIGLRCEESPGRRIAMTSKARYRHVTWGGGTRHRGHYNLYPIYDWSYTDVWKAIHDHGWKYCRLYDYMYQRGLPIQRMRVSSVHHEMAIKSLWYMQEVEPNLWERICRRIPGVHTAGQLQLAGQRPVELPRMFKSWREYRDHLLPRLISNADDVSFFRRSFAKHDIIFHPDHHDEVHGVHVDMIIGNDRHLEVWSQWYVAFGKDYDMNRRANRDKRLAGEPVKSTSRFRARAGGKGSK